MTSKEMAKLGFTFDHEGYRYVHKLVGGEMYVSDELARNLTRLEMIDLVLIHQAKLTEASITERAKSVAEELIGKEEMDRIWKQMNYDPEEGKSEAAKWVAFVQEYGDQIEI